MDSLTHRRWGLVASIASALVIAACGFSPSTSDTQSTTDASTGSTASGGSTTAGTSDVSASDATTATTTDPGTTTEPGLDECGGPGSNSYVDGDLCYCDLGFAWCSVDPTDFTCCPCGEHQHAEDGVCLCNEGYEPCEGDPSSCCGVEPMGCPNAAPPPEDPCDPQTELAYCTHPERCTPEGSAYYLCVDGAWALQEQPAQDQLCELDGFGFSFGCVDDGVGAYLVCGHGSGEACTADLCVNNGILGACTYGKVNEQDCQAACEAMEGPDGFYDLGECGDQGEGPQCLCSYEG
ncbi:MAG: hypothetical protein R3A51_01525 [Nannocystaceae bacterium]